MVGSDYVDRVMWQTFNYPKAGNLISQSAVDLSLVTKGGSSNKSLTPDQCKLDREARLTISQEMWNQRVQVTTAY